MSKWKYIRKKNIQRFKTYVQGMGLLAGISVYSMLNVVGGSGSLPASLLLLGIYVAYWRAHRNKFSRIRKAVRDARGENP